MIFEVTITNQNGVMRDVIRYAETKAKSKEEAEKKANRTAKTNGFSNYKIEVK